MLRLMRFLLANTTININKLLLLLGLFQPFQYLDKMAPYRFISHLIRSICYLPPSVIKYKENKYWN